MFNKIALLFVLVSLHGCSLDSTVLIYKKGFKKELIKICEKNEACIEHVENYHDQCLDEKKVTEMLITLDVDRSNELDRALQDETVACLNSASGVEVFISKQQEN